MLDFARISRRNRVSFAFSLELVQVRVATAPPKDPKPSAQTKIVLEAMEATHQKDADRWDEVMESLDLLFTRVTDMGTAQHQLKTQVEHSHHLMDQFGKDQQILQQQMAATGQAVANLTLEQMRASEGLDSPHPPFGVAPRPGFHQGQSSGGFVPVRSAVGHGHGSQDHRGIPRGHLPKMAFPIFDG